MQQDKEQVAWTSIVASAARLKRFPLWERNRLMQINATFASLLEFFGGKSGMGEAMETPVQIGTAA